MSNLPSERLLWAIAVAVAGLLLLALDVWWVLTYRHGYPLHVDEAAYTAIGLNDYLGLRGGGLHGWWEAFRDQAPNAPLVPALASFVYVVKAGVTGGFVVLGGFMVLLGVAVYGVAERLAGPRLGAVAGLAAITAPGVFLFLHLYLFSLPAAALLACAVYALLRSEGLRRRRWAIACGVALGLMLLARTMTVAFVPGVLAAGAMILLARKPRRPELARGFANLGLLLLAAGAVAAVWYWHNLQPVFDYLTNYGYGDKSAEFGASHSLLSWSRWTAVGERMVRDDFLLPLAILLAAGIVLALLAAAQRVRRAGDPSAALLRLAGSDAAAVGVVFAAGYLALSSSANAGIGFTLPLSVLLIPLAAAGLRRFRGVAVPAVAALALVAVVNGAAASDLWNGLSRSREVAVPGLERLPWLNGVPFAVADIRSQVAGPATRFADRDRGWLRADAALAALLVHQEGSPVVAFASRSHVLNTNTVGLAAVQGFQRQIPMAQLVADDGDSVRAYVRRLSDPLYGQPKLLITMSSERGDYVPHVTQAYAEEAARRLGFRRIETMTLPDGRLLRLWSQLLLT